MHSHGWPYDRVVDGCARSGIEILATLSGHFDRPAVPIWAEETLKDVIDNHSERLENFVSAWGERYRDRIRHWEILNEPRAHHAGLTLVDYAEKILKPAYQLLKSIDPRCSVLPCAFNHLPGVGSKDDFWDAARGYCDIHNYHLWWWGTGCITGTIYDTYRFDPNCYGVDDWA